MAEKRPFSRLRSGVAEPGKLDALLAYVAADFKLWEFSRKPQLGLYYLAQHAVDAGYRVQVDTLSSNDRVVQRLARLLAERDCPCIGFYVDHENQWELRRILPALKALRPGVDILLGGPQVTAAPEETLERMPWAFCGVIGEGEETFVELLGIDPRTPGSLKACRGLALQTHRGVVRTPERPPLEPLDRLSIPRRRDLSVEWDGQFTPAMITGRGCTGRCAFCFEGRPQVREGKRLRLHSARRCLEEFDCLTREYRGRYIAILDDTFVAEPKRLREFCRGLILRHKGRIKWFCEARADTLSREKDLLPLMIEAGLLRLQVGGESGCQEVLNAYRKGTTLEQVCEAVEAARTHGLHSLFINFIIGGAKETPETFHRTTHFALDLLRRAPGLVEVGHSFFTPYPGTPMWEHPGQFGLRILDRDGVTVRDNDQTSCRTEALGRPEIMAFGQDFQAAVQKTMEELIPVLPFETIERHFDAFRRWDLYSEWYRVLSENPGLAQYCSSLRSGKAVVLRSVPAGHRDAAVPFRTTELLATKRKCCTVRTPRGDLFELDDLNRILIELSAGKLNAKEILEAVGRQLPKGVFPKLQKAVWERFAHLDREGLLLWTVEDSGGTRRHPETPKFGKGGRG